MALHKTQNKEELWSTHWAFKCPAAKCFLTLAQFKPPPDAKIQNFILLLVDKLPPGSRHYRIAADNLFNLVDTCCQVAEKGHCIYWTVLADCGVPPELKEHAKELKQK
eukprot:633111-Rhodomonas_salina.1